MNLNMLFVGRLSKGLINSIAKTALDIRLKLSIHVEGCIVVIKISYINVGTVNSRTITRAVCTINNKGNFINVELSGTVERNIGLNQNILYTRRLSTERISNISENTLKY